MACELQLGLQQAVGGEMAGKICPTSSICCRRVSLSRAPIRQHSNFYENTQFFEFVLTKHTQAAVYDLQNSI